jgi:hypothetical protein
MNESEEFKMFTASDNGGEVGGSGMKKKTIVDSAVVNQLENFFCVKENFDTLYEILSRQSPTGVSLRLLDFLVTCFAEQFRSESEVTAENGKIYSIYAMYKAELMRRRKRGLDAFRRVTGGPNILVKEKTAPSSRNPPRKIESNEAQLWFISKSLCPPP